MNFLSRLKCNFLVLNKQNNIIYIIFINIEKKFENICIYNKFIFDERCIIDFHFPALP